MKRFIKTTITTAILLIASYTYAETPSTAPAPTPAAAENKVAVSPQEKTKIEQVVHEYLLQNPEIIIEAVQNYQRKQYEQAEQTIKKTQQTAASFAKPLFHEASDPVAGNPTGKITVVEFFDYQCPHCIDMVTTLDDVIKKNPDVRLVYKEFPIRGPISEYAARAALAANKQGKYNEFSHALLKSPKQPLTQESILALAKKSGLDVDKLKKDMTDKSIDEELKANLKLAKELQLFGTPAFFIGKTDVSATGTINYIPGEMNQAQLQTLIDKTRTG